MSDISDDEFTCLMLADAGESMIPIGRWEQPVKSLAAKGLLHANDSVNYVITPSGRVALADRHRADDKAYTQVLEIGHKIANARTQAQQSIEQAAQHLSFAAKASAIATGDTPEQAARNWHEHVLRRCLELLNG